MELAKLVGHARCSRLRSWDDASGPRSQCLPPPHAGGARGRGGAFAIVAGSLMGLAESLIPWARHHGGLPYNAGWGMVRYTGVNFLLYTLIVAGTEAAAHAWESRQRALAAAVYARQLAEARLHVLSVQLQPHFLFNALQRHLRARRREAPGCADANAGAARRSAAPVAGAARPGRGDARPRSSRASPSTCRDRARALRRRGCGSIRGGARVQDGAGAAPDPAAAGGERHAAQRRRPRSSGGTVDGARREAARGASRLSVQDDGVGLRRAGSWTRAPARPVGDARARRGAALRPGAGLHGRVALSGRGNVDTLAARCGWRGIASA